MLVSCGDWGIGPPPPFICLVSRAKGWVTLERISRRANGRLFLCKLEDASTHKGLFRVPQHGGGVIEMRLDQASSINAGDSGCSAYLWGQKQALPTARLAASHLPGPWNLENLVEEKQLQTPPPS